MPECGPPVSSQQTQLEARQRLFRSVKQSYADYSGVGLSALCLLHCLALPLLVSALPAAASVFTEVEWLHQLLVVLAAIMVGLAFTRGLRLHHTPAPALLAAAGLIALIISTALGEEHWAETGLVSAGALMTAVAHIWNHLLATRALGSAA